MTGKEFSSFDVNNYTSSDKEIKLFTFDGQNHTLSGMTGMLISKSWAGHSAMDVKNLTIANSTIEQDVNDINGTVGVGAICGNAEASLYLRITNVHLSNSTVRGGHWTGGLVGIAGGYDKPNDGPVLEKIYVTDCSVEGCTIEGKGSNGALVGHAATNPATLWEVEKFSVLNNSINNTGGKTDRTGALIGTLGDINRASTAFPGEKNQIWFTSPLVVTGNNVLGVANDAKKVGRVGTDGSPVYLDNVNVINNWL